MQDGADRSMISVDTTKQPAVPQAAQDLLETLFGFKTFRSHQAGIVAALIAGRDALVLMPTGGGKSLCYQIPALVREGTGIVISPLIALMQDQVSALAALGVNAKFLNSTLDRREQMDVERALTAGELDLLYIAPERLLNGRMLELLDTTKLALFAIDEAHCVSQWGHDFRPEYRQLSILADRYEGVPRIALTATADTPTRKEIVRELRLEQASQFVASFDRPNIRYIVSDGGRGARDKLWQFLADEHGEDAGIIYCLSRRGVEDTAQWLVGKGRTALAYHAGLPSEQRRTVQERFLREDGIIVVATIAFGMGIDKPDVRFVAHLNLPKSVEAYYQETGRAGRDGAAADAWLSYGLQDLITLQQFISNSDANEERKRIERMKLDAIVGLCEMTTCRRQALLAYFDETLAEPCGNCDNCLTPPETTDGTEAARKALSAVYRTGQRFGVGYIIDVLRGKTNERILTNRHDELSTFAIGENLNEGEWRDIFRELVARAYLAADVERYGALNITEKARLLLRGEETFLVRKRRRPPPRDKRQRDRRAAATVSAGDEGLFETLRSLRLQLASDNKVPPYVICHDATLHDMLALRPETADQLKMVHGMGDARVKRYGSAFLEAIANHQ